jgi:hypothetical protein
MSRRGITTVDRFARLIAVLIIAVLPLLTATSASSSTSTSIPTPQTTQPPFGASLNARMAALWHDLANDSLTSGEKLFFPESAYVAMKTGQIPDPTSDYIDRLIGFFRLDLAAYHSYIFAHGAASFVGINVNPGDALWIRPGWCENSIGYWHVPGVRLVYREGGLVRSVAVASLISWHGEWFIVHLGPNPRAHNVGTVDAPALGRGVAGPAGGC